ncbi:MAG: tetratricopeptide repeat protein [Planctomycetes bacterium]|nr:tetratricopeptide repeat protein [Planctomycetota bacterium]
MRDDPERNFDLAELAEFCGLPLRTLRGFVERQLLLPSAGAGARFGFRAVGQARVLAELWREGWAPARIQRALRLARTVVPDHEAALTGLQASIGQRRLVVRTPDGRLVEPNGQLWFDFANGHGAGDRLPQLRSPQDWFAAGVDAEAAGRFDDAIRAYEHALPAATADVHFNLGNCYFTQRQRTAACRQFEAAIQLAPDFAEAWNNLGIARGALGERRAAIDALHQALRLVPHYADAHYNLAEALAVTGDIEGARRHWRAYLTYDPNSRWADQVRKRLLNHGG